MIYFTITETQVVTTNQNSLVDADTSISIVLLSGETGEAKEKSRADTVNQTLAALVGDQNVNH